MLVISREKLLFWDPCCTSRVSLTAYVMSVLRGLHSVWEIFLFLVHKNCSIVNTVMLLASE